MSNPKPDLHNIKVHTKFDEKSIKIYSSYHPEMRIQTDGWMVGHIGSQPETIITCHYHVVGYRKGPDCVLCTIMTLNFKHSTAFTYHL